METDQQSKNSIIIAAKKRLERIELRLKDLEMEIMELKQLFNSLPEERIPVSQVSQVSQTPQAPQAHAPGKSLEKPKLLKRKKEVKPEPVATPEPEKPVRRQEGLLDPETITFETQIPQPKPPKPPEEKEIQLDGVELRFLKLISGQEEGEHQLPFIANQLSLTQERVQDVVGKLIDKGLLYSPNPIDPNAEFYIDQKGLEALAKKGLL